METSTPLTTKDAELITEYMRGTDALILQATRAEIVNRETFARGGDLGKIISARIKKLDDGRLFLVKPLNDHVKAINAEVKLATNPLATALGTLRGKMSQWAIKERERKDAEERQRRADEDAAALVAADAAEKAAKDAAQIAADARTAEADATRRGDEEGAAEFAQVAGEADAASVAHQDSANETLNKAADRPEADTRVQKTRGDYGSVTSMKKVWKVELQDLSSLPKGYLQLIQANIKARAAILAVIKPLTDDAIKKGEQIPGLRIFQDDQLQIR